MASKGQVSVVITGDAKDLVAAVKQGETALGGLGKASDETAVKGGALSKVLGSGGLAHVAGEAGSEVKGLAEKTASQLSPALGQAVGHVSSITSHLGGASTALIGVGGGAVAAGAAIGEMALHGVNDLVSLAGEVRNVQRVTGSTAEEASKLNVAFKMTGVDATAGSTAMFMLAKNTELHAAKLHDAGIEIAHNSKGGVDLAATLANVAEAYKKTGGGAEGAALASVAFGKQGKALLPILAAGKDQLDEFYASADKHHEILSQDDLTKAREYQIATKELGESFSGLERELGVKLIPVLTDAAKLLTGAVEDVDKLGGSIGSVTDKIPHFGEKLQHALHDGVGPLAVGVDVLSGHFKQAALDVVPFGSEVERLTGSSKAALPHIKGLATQLGDMGTAAFSAAIEAEKTAAAQAQIASASAEVAGPLKLLTDQLGDGAKAMKALTDATLASFDADLRYQNATLDTKDAIDKVTAATMTAYAAKGKDATANEDLTRATNAAYSAILAQAAGAAESARQHATMRGETLGAADAAAIERQELQKVESTLAPDSPLRKQLDAYIYTLAQIPGHISTQIEQTFTTPTVGSASRPAAPGGVTRRASGGPLGRGEVAIVGEQGPEVFVPDTAGTVLPNRGGRAATPGGDTYVTVHVAGNATPDTVALIRRELTAWSQDAERKRRAR